MKRFHDETLVDFEAYINAIIDSLGSTAYRRYFVWRQGQCEDILEDGQLSCAYYLSNILAKFGLIRSGHCTVKSTIRDMVIDSGWYPVNKPGVGAALLWEPEFHPQSGRTTEHIGFYIFDFVNLAISHRDDIRAPRVHHWTYGVNKDGSPVRRVKAIYWHDRLGPRE